MSYKRNLVMVLAIGSLLAGQAFAETYNLRIPITRIQAGSTPSTPSVPSTPAAVTLAPSALPVAYAGEPYSADLSTLVHVSGGQSDGSTGIGWSLLSGALPEGLSLSAQGLISGVPTNGGFTSQFSLRVSYQSAAGDQAYEIVTGAVAVTLAATTLPAATQNSAYGPYDFKSLLAVSGDPVYPSSAVTFSPVTALPAGLSLTSDGVLSGTPTAASAGAQVRIQASYRQATGQQSYTLAIDPQTYNITQQGGVRAWSDGTYSASCKEYLDGNTTHKYTGDTGSGVYRLSSGGTTFDAYCDMTTAGGGWTRMAFFNQASTAYSTVATNVSPSTNWNMPTGLVKNFTTTEKLLRATRQGLWVAFAPGSSSGTWSSTSRSFTAAATNSLAYQPAYGSGSQGALLWVSGGYPYTLIDNFNPCGNGNAVTLVMASATGAGTDAGIQVWSGGCDSANYHKQDVPFEIYSR